MKQIYLKVLFAIALVLAGSSANAQFTKILYPTGNTDPTKGTVWTGNGINVLDGDGYASLSNGNSGPRYAYLKFYETGNDFYADYESYTISFDVYSVNCWSGNYNVEAGVTAFSEGANIPSSPSASFASANTGTKNYLFDLHNQATWITTFKVNGASEATIAMDKERWFNIKLDVTVATGEVAYTVTDLATNATVANGTGTYNATADGSNAKCQGLFFQVGRNAENRYINVRNVSVTTEVSEEVAADPAIVLTGINGTSRTYSISFNEGETLHYKTPGESDYSTATESPKVVTVNTSGTLSAYTTRGTATSATVETTVDATAIALNAPTFTATAYADKKYTVEIYANQAGVGLEPASQISYRIGEEGEFTAYSAPVAVEEGKTIYAYAESAGYTTSATTNYATEARPAYETVWTQNYTNIVTEGNGAQGVVLNSEADFTVDGVSFYNIIGYDVNGGPKDVNLNKNVGLSTTQNFFLRVNGNNSGILKNGGTGYIGIQNLNVGDVIIIGTNGNDFLTPASGLTQNVGMCTRNEFVYTATATEASLSVAAGTYHYITNVTVLTAPVTSVTTTIGTTGYATFSSTYALDLTDVEAYYVTADGVGNETVTLTKAEGTVPAGTGLILAGEGEVTIPVAATGTELEGNLLVGCTTATEVEAAANKYVLVANGTAAEFQSLVEKGATIPAGKAYLEVPASAGAKLYISFGDATAIKNVEVAPATDGIYYNLAGQRVANPTKGIYIVNGQKVLVK